MSYRLAPQVELRATPEGGVLTARRPLRMLRLNPALHRLLAGDGEGRLRPGSEGDRRILETLVEKGFVERGAAAAPSPAELPTVSVVIPVKDRAGELRTCLASLAALDYPAERLEIIVVDDGSSDDTRAVAGTFRVLLTDSGGVGLGPAAARNRGAAVAGGEILAFIDSDCTASPEWLRELLPVFADARVAAIGGWVDGLYRTSGLDRYEAVMSSLNLGRRERSGAAGGDTFYLPSCNLLVRRRAFQAAGGFRSELRVGEDVDLTWRLRDAGGTILYRPQGTVYHAHRSRLWPFVRRRFDYGTSEGLLQELHPVRGKKMLLPPLLTALLALLALALVTRSCLPLAPALLLLFADTALTRRRLQRQGQPLPVVPILLARARAAGSLGYYLGYHLLRYYLPALLLITLGYPPFGLLVVVTLLGVATVDHQVRRAPLALPRFWCFYLLEQLAYGSGVFMGCLRLRNFTSYRLDLQAEGR